MPFFLHGCASHYQTFVTLRQQLNDAFSAWLIADPPPDPDAVDQEIEATANTLRQLAHLHPGRVQPWSQAQRQAAIRAWRELDAMRRQDNSVRAIVDFLADEWLKQPNNNIVGALGLSTIEAREALYSLAEHGLVKILLDDSDNDIGIAIDVDRGAVVEGMA